MAARMRDRQLTQPIIFSDLFLLLRERDLTEVLLYFAERFPEGEVACSLCQGEFLSIEELEIHFQSHKEGRQECPECHLWIADVQLKRHINTHRNPQLSCDLCSFTTTHPKSLKVHMKAHKESPKMHECPVCFKQLRGKYNLKGHLERHTSKPLPRKYWGQHVCPKCGRRFKLASYLSHHMAIHEGRRRRFECNVCAKTFPIRSLLSRHMERHTHGRVQCTLCNKLFIDSTSLKVHARSHFPDGGKPHRCSWCSQRFATEEGWKCHEKTHEPGGQRAVFECELCHKRLMTLGGLTQHIERHKNVKCHVCPQCDKAFITSAALRRHMPSHSSNKPIQCGICQRAFKSRGYLRVHMQRHDNKREHECTVCAKRFNTRSDLTGHMVFHTGQKNFACSQCDTTFLTNKLLQQHLVVHADTRDYTCPHCESTFKSEGAVKTHLKTHLAPEARTRFHCDRCDASFLYSGSLTKHVRDFHTKADDQQLFTCPKCNNSYKNRSSLRCHVKRCGVAARKACPKCPAKFKDSFKLTRHLNTVHTDVKRYECHVCQKKFSSAGDVSNHVKRHDLTKQHACEMCETGFHTRTDLKQHQVKHDSTTDWRCTFCSARFLKHRRVLFDSHVESAHGARC